MIPDPARELLDLAAVHVFYMGILEEQLGHPLPIPHELGNGGDLNALARHSVSTLQRWLNLLDLATTAPMVRDALKNAATNDTAEALLRYYVVKHSPLASDRDKTDFIATFLFRRLSPDPPAVPTPEPPCRDADGEFHIPEEKSLPFEAQICRILGDVPIPPLPEEHRQLVREFQYVKQEVDEFRHFDKLMDSGVMQRVRDIKQAFGASFYHPRVLATVAEYNVFFGVHFDTLFLQTTRHIKRFAERVQEEGGSVMSRVDGDVILKHLTEVEEQEILQTEYIRAQEAFRRVSRMKKAVDSRGPMRPGAPTASVQPQSPPIRDGKDLIEDSKLKAVEDSIVNFVRAAKPEASRLVPLPHGNISLTEAEAEAFRSEHGSEKSFRAEFASVLRLAVALQARMMAEIEAYRGKQKSAYLWKPHADSLAYLLKAGERTLDIGSNLIATSQQRGLVDKVNAMTFSLRKLRMQSAFVTKALGSAG